MLLKELLRKGFHHLRRLNLLAERTAIVILEPLLNTVRVVHVTCITSQRRHIVLTFLKVFHTNEAFL